MSEDSTPYLARIAEALERLAPPAPPAPDFAAARLFRYETTQSAFLPAPDYALALDLLVGVDRQKARFMENLARFARALPCNHVLLWGARGAGKSSLAKAGFMAETAEHPALRMVEIDRDHIAALPELFEGLRGRAERFVVLCDDLSFEEGAAAAKSLSPRSRAGSPGRRRTPCSSPPRTGAI